MLIANIPAGNIQNIIMGAELIQTAKPTYVTAITYNYSSPCGFNFLVLRLLNAQQENAKPHFQYFVKLSAGLILQSFYVLL